MPRKRTASVSVPPERCFVKELAGETPPSFQAMERLYGLALELYGLRPGRVLDEDNLTVVRDGVSGELCYCTPTSVQRDFASFARWKLKRSPIPANSSHPRTASMWSSCPELGCSDRISNCLSHWDIRRAEA